MDIHKLEEGFNSIRHVRKFYIILFLFGILKFGRRVTRGIEPWMIEAFGKTQIYFDYSLNILFLILSIAIVIGLIKWKRWAHNLILLFIGIYTLNEVIGFIYAMTHPNMLDKMVDALSNQRVGDSVMTVEQMKLTMQITFVVKIIIAAIFIRFGHKHGKKIEEANEELEKFKRTNPIEYKKFKEYISD